MNKVFFLGRFPAHNKVGGVTTFTHNFAEKFNDSEIVFLDIYPSKRVIFPEGAEVIFFNGSRLVCLLKLIKFSYLNKGSWFFNFSSIKSVLFMALLRKPTGYKWFSIFHNGSQSAELKKLNWFSEFLVKKCIKKIDAIGCLSEKQDDFFASIFKGKRFRVSPFISLDKSEASIKTPAIEHSKTIFLISGFATKIYRFFECFEMFDSMWEKNTSFEVNICIYGEDNEGMQEQLIKLASSKHYAKVYQFLGTEEFQALLHSSDLYIRPNSVDSYGLVVAEAINIGVPVIATNVCERYPGTYLIEKDDFATLKNNLEIFIKEKKFSDNLPRAVNTKELVNYNEVLEFLKSRKELVHG